MNQDERDLLLAIAYALLDMYSYQRKTEDEFIGFTQAIKRFEDNRKKELSSTE